MEKMYEWYIYKEKEKNPTPRYIVCPVQKSPRIHSYHVDLFNLETLPFRP